jgi:CCR4-NOT transcription complex subunit 1
MLASISTQELVIKYFATEPNEDKMSKASHLMAQKLAGSLASVTCKEPLKSNMTSHVRQYLTENGFNKVWTGFLPSACGVDTILL